MTTIEARISGRLVRTFGAMDLALRYRDRMKAVGARVELESVTIERREVA